MTSRVLSEFNKDASPTPIHIPFTVGLYNAVTKFIDFRQNEWHKWVNRVEPFVKVINSSSEDGLGPALLGLVEMNCEMLDDLKVHLPQYRWVGRATMIDKPFQDLETTDYIGELLVIGYRPDAGVEFTGTEGMRWLSPTPEIPCSRFSTDSRSARGIYYARFSTPIGNVAAFCTHYDDFSMDARKLSLEVEAQFIKSVSKDDLVLSMGDRNPFPDRKGEPKYPHGVGIKHMDELISLTKLTNGISSTDHHGPEGTWIGWETDAFRCKFEDGQWNSKDRVYDMILSSRSPTKSYHYPGQYQEDRSMVPLESTDFNTDNRLFASDHCMVLLQF